MYAIWKRSSCYLSLALSLSLARSLARPRSPFLVNEASSPPRASHIAESPLHDQSYLTESAYKVVLQKSIPAQIRQLILYY